MGLKLSMLYIYCYTNLINQKRYIGATSQEPSERWKAHPKAQSELGEDIRKFGLDNFKVEVIDTAETVEELLEREKYWVKEYNTLTPNGYNQITPTVPVTQSIKQPSPNSYTTSEEFKTKLNNYMKSLTLEDIYEILSSPSLLYRTGKHRHRLTIFSSKQSYERYEKAFFKNLHKIKIKLMIEELTKEGYTII
jgi:group I intron endonuclease